MKRFRCIRSSPFLDKKALIVRNCWHLGVNEICYTIGVVYAYRGYVRFYKWNQSQPINVKVKKRSERKKSIMKLLTRA